MIALRQPGQECTWSTLERVPVSVAVPGFSWLSPDDLKLGADVQKTEVNMPTSPPVYQSTGPLVHWSTSL